MNLPVNRLMNVQIFNLLKASMFEDIGTLFLITLLFVRELAIIECICMTRAKDVYRCNETVVEVHGTHM